MRSEEQYALYSARLHALAAACRVERNPANNGPQPRRVLLRIKSTGAERMVDGQGVPYSEAVLGVAHIRLRKGCAAASFGQGVAAHRLHSYATDRFGFGRGV